MTVLPNDINAEISVLGGCLLNSITVKRVLPIIQPKDFYLEKHQLMFEGMISLEADHIQVDIITLQDRLLTMGYTERVGKDYPFEIAAQVGTSAGWKYHADLIKKHAVSRAIILQCGTSASLLQSQFEDPSAVISDLRAALRGITLDDMEDCSNLKLYNDLYDEMGNKDDTYEPGYSTGIGNLDDQFHFEPGYINCIGAEPNIGKSPLMLQIADHIAHKYGPTYYFSLESTRKMLAKRIYARTAKVHLSRIHSRNIYPNEWEKITQAAEQATRSSLYLIDNSNYLYVEALVNYIESVALNNPVKFIVIDFLQYQYTTQKMQSRHHEISYILSKYKGLAKDLNIPILCASQLDKAMQKRDDRRPRAGDFKESGDIITMVDNVLGMYAPEKLTSVGKLPEYQVEIFTIKSKEQEPFSTWLNFNGHFQEFTDGQRPAFQNISSRKRSWREESNG
jgi:replicative DNA helicase